MSSLPPGTLLAGRYRLTRPLGEGGMSVVWHAETVDRGEPVAVKMLHEQLLGNDPSLIQRFEREARALRSLEHPNILRVFDSGVDGRRPFLVMELLHGGPLSALMDEGAPDPEVALDLFRQIVSGMAFAHAQGVLHRDLKSENVFVTRGPDGRYHAKLLDFGLAKFTDRDRWGNEAALTVAGTIFGTPAYMSPEQATGAPMDTRSDVYSLGAILFELLTGEWPFDEDDQAKMLRAHLIEPVRPLRAARPALVAHPSLERLVRQCMAKKPDERPRDAGAVLKALDALPERPARLGAPPAASGPGAQGALIGVGIGVGLALLLAAVAAAVLLG